ncbi:DUF4157 domain-containing protein [Candidatus Pacearchaeota archaeon]|jgi:hypothetical protein|nr:DUF4157 domain-containing protein [Candidatus Pacearchaeota archaeon]
MIFNTFENEMHKHYSFDIKYKNKSLFMKLLGFLLFFNKGFMTKYITTIGSTIYFTSEDFVNSQNQSAISVLAHELVHIQQAKRYGKVLFSILYLFPQCLAVFALLAPISLWFLLFLLCLAPLPAPWRTKFEVGGYTMSLFVLNEQLIFFQNSPDKIYEILCEESDKINRIYFVGPSYWFMWPFGVSYQLQNNIVDILDGVIGGKDEIYDCVRQSYLNAVSSTSP